MISSTSTILVGAATAASVGYAYTELEGFLGMSLAVVVSAVIALVMFTVMRSLYQFVLWDLPTLEEDQREKAIPLAIAGLSLAIFISVSTAALWLGRPAAENAHFRASIERSNTSTAEAVSAMRTALALRGRINTKKAETAAFAEIEKSSGGLCGSGRGGTGTCYTVSISTVVAADTVVETLDRIASESDSLIQRIEGAQDKIRRVQENPNLSYAERVSEVNENLAIIQLLVSQLQSYLPVEAVRGLAQTYSQDWSQLGLSRVGAERLRSSLRPLAQDLREAAADMEAARTVKIEGIVQRNPYELVLQHASSIFPMLALSALPDFTGVCLLLLSYWSARSAIQKELEDRDEWGGPDDDSEPPALSDRERLQALIRDEIAQASPGSARVAPLNTRKA
ncbi:MAG: hypothetical protein AAFQ13_07690 [Pseudomonadota bacterium]